MHVSVEFYFLADWPGFFLNFFFSSFEKSNSSKPLYLETENELALHLIFILCYISWFTITPLEHNLNE